MCRYPTSSARTTAATALRPRACQVPGPCRGIFVPDASSGAPSTPTRSGFRRVPLGRAGFELEADEGLVPDAPRVGAGLDDVGRARRDLVLGAVVMRDVH